jgi:membrane-bound serine protease (ClpP class)
MRAVVIHIIFLISFPAFIAAQKVISIKIDGSINPASAGFIHNAIEKASDEHAVCLLIHLNTPGGLLKSTRSIVGDMLESQVPIIVYVSPGGAHAGSAGVFITMAAHIAAMAPGTNIGAAHPVNLQGAPDSTMNEKATNDAVAFIKTIAEERKRNAAWGDSAVSSSLSITEIEALQKNVIDIIAPNERALLNMVDGKVVKLYTSSVTLNTKNAVIERQEMSFIEKLLNLLSDPNVAYILMMIGFYGILFELYNPSTLIPGIAGGICLILAFYAMHTLPINYAGVALICFGIVLFLLEIKIVSHGMLTIGGVISLLLGSLMLIKRTPGLEFLHISLSVIITTTVVTALFFLVVLGFGLKAQRLKPVTGIQGLMGAVGECIMPVDPLGTVSVHGEVWNAATRSGHINAGEKVRITGVNGLTLFVEATGSEKS